MRELTLEEAIEIALSSRSVETQNHARKIKKNWEAGITPGAGDLKKLYRTLHVVNPCVRLNDDGTCNGWLRKHGVAEGLIAIPPYPCPFAAPDNKDSKFQDCAGYRAV